MFQTKENMLFRENNIGIERNYKIWFPQPNNVA